MENPISLNHFKSTVDIDIKCCQNIENLIIKYVNTNKKIFKYTIDDQFSRK